MNLSVEHIERLAVETGFRSEILEKVIRLGELLFPDDGELVNQLIHHPALLWKIRNVKRHLAK